MQAYFDRIKIPWAVDNFSIFPFNLKTPVLLSMTEQVKNRENLSVSPPTPIKDEKFTSFCEPADATDSTPPSTPPTPPTPPVEPIDAGAVKPPTGRIMLSRKPPVLKVSSNRVRADRNITILSSLQLVKLSDWE